MAFCACGCGRELKCKSSRFAPGHNKQPTDPIRRFWRFVDTTGRCWEWTGSKHRFGYGRFNVGGKVQYAHRFAYEASFGVTVPEGMQVCHHCDNPRCVKPSHLFLGTAADNNWDKARKGRTVNPMTDALKQHTHCPKGHPYDELNTLVRRYRASDGSERPYRACRACLRAWGRAWYNRLHGKGEAA